MTIYKSFISTVVFMLATELITVWALLHLVVDISILFPDYYEFINGLIQIVVVSFFLFRRFGVKGIVPTSTSLSYYGLALLLGASYVFIQTPLNLLYNLLLGVNYHIIYDFDISQVLSLRALSIVFFVPISEELFFRNYIQKGLDSTHKPYVSIGLTAFLFASIHLSFMNLIDVEALNIHSSYIALFGGFLSGLLYFKSRSTGPSIVFHIMWNMAVTLI